MQLAEKVTSQDKEIRVVKELVENVFYEQHEEMVREPQKSHTSRIKKSGASICSSRESLTNSSVASLRTNKFRKNRENCIKKLKFQPSFLREKFSDRQEIFDIQKRLCRGLINGKDQITSGDEIQKLEESYQTMVSAAVRLREHLPSEEANDIDIHVEQEESEVFEVKKQMVKLMTRKSQAGEDEIVEGKPVKNKVSKEGNERMRSEMERLKARLDNQKELIDDLLLTRDQDMIRRELLTLDKVYDDYVAAIVHLRENACA